MILGIWVVRIYIFLRIYAWIKVMLTRIAEAPPRDSAAQIYSTCWNCAFSTAEIGLLWCVGEWRTTKGEGKGRSAAKWSGQYEVPSTLQWFNDKWVADMDTSNNNIHEPTNSYNNTPVENNNIRVHLFASQCNRSSQCSLTSFVSSTAPV